MFVVFCGNDDDFEPVQVGTLEQAFAQIVCRCGLAYHFEQEADCWRLVLTDVERPERSPDSILSQLKKREEAKRDLLTQAVDGRLRGLIALRSFEFERYRRCFSEDSSVAA